MNDIKQTFDILKQLKEKGYQVSIDDFGTGYSSFSYLSQMEFDTLKIAIPFVRGIQRKVEDLQIIKAIIKILKILHMKVIAEGVENNEQLRLLFLQAINSNGCH